MIKLFLDLDGTLAKFNSKRNALKRFDNEIGFFANLKPYKYIEFVNTLALSREVSVYIISATPNEQADKDKLLEDLIKIRKAYREATGKDYTGDENN